MSAQGRDGWDCHVHVFDAQAPARPGHYAVSHHPLEAIEAIAAEHSIGHLVIVQPSVYGSDHRVLLRALQGGAGRHRGVAVVEPAVSDAELDRLHAAGVRGIRFNLVSPVGHGGNAQADLAALAPRLRERNWHVQWYVDAAQLPWLADRQAACGLPFVLDHLGGLHTCALNDTSAWAAAARLADAGAWLKLSGAYRSTPLPVPDHLEAVLRRALGLFGARVVWGSDWPHTSLAPERLPSYASLMAPLRAVLDPDGVGNVLARQPRALYDLHHPEKAKP